MAVNKDLTVEEKLQALFSLQKMDSEVDEIRRLRGELPIEVSDLEDEMEGLRMRIENLEKNVAELNKRISDNQLRGKESDELIEKYQKQQMNVKNNREYDALTKEIEMQSLERDLAKKKTRDAEKEIKSFDEYLAESRDKMTAKEKELEVKKEELKKITAETEKQETSLLKKREKAKKDIETRLIEAYERIRRTYRNGLGVVYFERDSCGGCYGKIPPQRQLEIKQRKKIIVCEHCGRVLVDPDIETKRVDID